MKLKITLAAVLLTALPSLAAAAGCSYGKQAMSCAEGSIYDSETGTCVKASA
ncbi:hypothetical protein [Sulfitobacter sp. S190]|uniref:hypothetical protein n=1 Tax=Sulfitobacter sp. S190 TaxID=2867022 RepID=UPI0021A5556B|nr:hypothetical protein [Sulfitobacter sp. S190]UWR21312.1 hypothetical protein K3756_11385 [Sulfitobacter sp. S190]